MKTLQTAKKIAITVAIGLGLASTQASAIPVDTELSIVIDVSGSVNSSEYSLMMDGYAGAFRDGTIQSNILSTADGDIGSIAVNVVFFESSAFSTVLDSFSLLDSALTINAFADTLDTFARPGSGGTNIASGMNASTALFNGNGFESTNLIMDVSGDGTSTISTTQAARNAAAAAGITVNGISIGSTSIETFYNANVRTTDGFVIHATSFAEFSTGIENKLSIETGGGNPGAVPAPTSLALMGLGILGFAAQRKKS